MGNTKKTKIALMPELQALRPKWAWYHESNGRVCSYIRDTPIKVTVERQIRRYCIWISDPQQPFSEKHKIIMRDIGKALDELDNRTEEIFGKFIRQASNRARVATQMQAQATSHLLHLTTSMAARLEVIQEEKAASPVVGED